MVVQVPEIAGIGCFVQRARVVSCFSKRRSAERRRGRGQTDWQLQQSRGKANELLAQPSYYKLALLYIAVA